jgi:hypothetical protein
MVSAHAEEERLARLLGYVTALVNQELLLRKAYLVAENRDAKRRGSLGARG